MMHGSMLEGEELRIFEELISRFDSLSEAQMSAVGVIWNGPRRICWRIWPTGSGPRLNRFVNSKLESGERKSARAPRFSASTGRSFPRIGPRHGIFFARNSS